MPLAPASGTQPNPNSFTTHSQVGLNPTCHMTYHTPVYCILSYWLLHLAPPRPTSVSLSLRSKLVATESLAQAKNANAKTIYGAAGIANWPCTNPFRLVGTLSVFACDMVGTLSVFTRDMVGTLSVFACDMVGTLSVFACDMF